MSAIPVVRYMEREFERVQRIERKLARLARDLGAGEGNAGGVWPRAAFWRNPRGLALRSALYDRRSDELVVAFAAGPEYRMAASSLRLASPVKEVRLDDLGYGMVLRLADGTETSVASDLVLFECDPQYRRLHQERRPARGSASRRDPSGVGARLRTLRLAAGRSARKVAAAAGLAPSNYARLEASRHQPRIETLVRVARALGVPLATVLADHGP